MPTEIVIYDVMTFLPFYQLAFYPFIGWHFTLLPFYPFISCDFLLYKWQGQIGQIEPLIQDMWVIKMLSYLIQDILGFSNRCKTVKELFNSWYFRIFKPLKNCKKKKNYLIRGQICLSTCPAYHKGKKDFHLNLWQLTVTLTNVRTNLLYFKLY